MIFKMLPSTYLSPLSLLWISLTSMIGSGWLFGALYSAHFAGPAAILAWPIGGSLLILVALSYAEVSTMFPQQHSLALLPFYTHGHLTSMILSCLAWISLATIPVIETQGLIQYASNYLPGLLSQHGTRYIVTPLGYAISLTILASFVLLNYFGIRLFSRINACFTLWKIAIPSITIIALFCLRYQTNNFLAFGGFMPYGWQGVMTAMSNGGVLFSLLGFRQVVIMMNQIENPGKYVPIILIGSLILTTLLYTALQWVFIGSMRPDDLINGWANLSFPGDAGPFAALAVLIGLIWLSSLLYIDAIISPYSTGLVYSTTAAEMLTSISSMGNIALELTIQNKYHVSYISLFINFLLGSIIFLLLRSWQEMSAFSVAAIMITYSLGPISLVCLRKQLPNYHRPFRLQCGYFIAFLGFYICTAGVYWSGFNNILKLLLLVAATLVLYLFYYYHLNKSLQIKDWKNAIWIIIYFAATAVFSYFGNYGGNHFIPPYWDLLYLMGVCLIIFNIAFISRKTAPISTD